MTSDLAPLRQMKGVDILSVPKITTKLGTKAKIGITREFKIEGQEPITTGIELEITANQTPTGFSYSARYKLTEFEGSSDTEGNRLLIFQTITIPFNGLAQDNVPILMDATIKNESNKKCYIHLTIKKV